MSLDDIFIMMFYGYPENVNLTNSVNIIIYNIFKV